MEDVEYEQQQQDQAVDMDVDDGNIDDLPVTQEDAWAVIR
jgi:hypothetical protein